MKSSSALWKRLGPAMIAAITFFATLFSLPAQFKWVPRIDDLLAALVEPDAPYDVVHLGSSRVYRQISPNRFDRRLARRGHPLRSFNAGVGGMRIVESTTLLEQIVTDPRTRPRWILLEASGFFERIEPENLTSPRTLYWHDLGATILAARSTQLARMDGLDRFRQAGRHLHAGGYHALNLGTWSSHVAAWLGLLRATEPRATEARGFAALPSDPDKWTPAQARRRDLFVTKRDGYDGRIANFRREAKDAQSLTGFVPDVLRRAKRTADRHGVGLVFLLAPQSIGGPEVARTIADGEIGPLIDFANPIRYPTLFDRQLRFDREHLNERGSRLFSARLAEAFADLLDARDTAP